eukprot:CAMPEP_0169427470 /NCGR_PEP_ID=MMETSP1042-20121227/789_1 /TAXON_ID=464988 /ORGANISM="Hemiselmis andersenii, Strain CCMP1180" /LENGTH=89 /DNA_ID=CAMNT_0009537533 /DNA_START=65 /DNA_END=334 /DNA_ORIENTATION=+
MRHQDCTLHQSEHPPPIAHAFPRRRVGGREEGDKRISDLLHRRSEVVQRTRGVLHHHFMRYHKRRVHHPRTRRHMPEYLRDGRTCELLG